jgi:TetR/AcrR family transcriptional regulator
MWTFVIAHPGVPRFIFHELQQPADSPAKQEVRAVLQAYRQAAAGSSCRRMQVGQLPRRSTRMPPPRCFVGIVQGLVMQSMLTGRPGGHEGAGGGVFALYLRGIRAAP